MNCKVLGEVYVVIYDWIKFLNKMDLFWLEIEVEIGNYVGCCGY